MRDTLPFAPFALRELAEHWQRQLAQARDPSEVTELKSRIAELYVQILATDPDSDVRRRTGGQLLAILEAHRIDCALLERAAEIARDDQDDHLYRSLIELLARSEDVDVRRRALERLGDLFEELGNRRAAVESWKPAARLRPDTCPGREHARRLYERTLEAQPDDGEAAEQLALLYAESGTWDRVPEAMGVVVRANAVRASELLLRIVPSALAVGASRELSVMVDEAVASLPPASPEVRDLLRAKARALASAPGGAAAASETYRALLQAFACDADRRDYEAYIESMVDAADRHREHRWLYSWRAANEARPEGALLAWAKVEEASGHFDLAVALLSRLPAAALDDVEALELLSDMRLRAGDWVGAFEAVERLAQVAAPADRLALGRRLAGVFETSVDLASHPDDARAAVALFERRVHVARALGQMDALIVAYGRALVRPDIDPVLAEGIGSRWAALDGESNLDPSFFVETLGAVLEVVPNARWALDRVKLPLVLQARWATLFHLFDRAIDSAPGERERFALLEEAAVAARDLANDGDRAARYLKVLCKLRPDDPAALTALEHLCERYRRTGDLAELLEHRAVLSEDTLARPLWRRVAALRLDLGQATEAAAAIEAALASDEDLGVAQDLLERLARHSGQHRAVDRLVAHYERLGRTEDCIRVIKAALALPGDAGRRVSLVRALVRLRLSGSGDVAGFASATAQIDSDVAGLPALGTKIWQTVLIRAVAASRGAPTDADFADAVAGASHALEAWTTLLLQTGDARRASCLLRRGARLPFERARRRELLQRAAELSSDVAGDAAAAIRILDELFLEDGTDEIAARLVDRFARLLRLAGREDRLAALWESRAAHGARTENEAEERASWRRAGEAWERHDACDRALAAYHRAAALGCAESYAALARMHAEHGRWPDAVASLEWLYVHSDGARRHGFILQLADAYLALDERARARACFEEVLSSCESEQLERVRGQLAALYRRDGLWRPLADMLSNIARTAADPSLRVAMCREAAGVLRSKLGAPAEAVAPLELAAASDPGELDLLLELVDTLEEIGQWGRAADLLRQRMARVGDQRPKERPILHHRLGRALAGANDRTGALVQLRAASRMRPAHPAILQDLARVAFEAGELDLAEQTYRALLLTVRHPPEGEPCPSPARVLFALGEIAARKGDAVRAAELLESAHESALDAGDDPSPIQSKLCEMGRHDAVVRALTYRAEHAGDVSERTVALRHLVRLWRVLARDAELGQRIARFARDVLDELAREGAGSGAVWAGIWSVHIALDQEGSLLQMAERLVPLLREALPRTEGDADRAWLRVALAKMLAHQPGQGAAAADLLAGGADRVAGDDDVRAEYASAVWRVGAALEHADDRAGAARLYESIVDGRPLDLQTARALACRLEAVGSSRVVDVAERIFDLDSAKGAAPEDRPLLRRLVEAYDATGSAEKNLRLLERAAEAQPGDAELLALRSHARAHTRRELEAVVAADPHHLAALERLASLAAAEGAWKQAAAAYRRLVEVCVEASGVEPRACLARAVPGLLDACERANGLADVRELLEAAHRILPACERLDRTLEGLYERTGAWAPLGALLAARAERVQDVAARMALLLRAATVLIDRANRLSSALPLIERARAEHPESIDAALAWAKLQVALGRPRDALAALENLVERNRGKRTPSLAPVYLAIGKAHLANDDLIEALEALKAGFAIESQRSELAMLVGLVALDIGDEKTAERAFLAVAMSAPRKDGSGASASDKVEASYRLAAMAYESGDHAKARRLASKAAGDDPAHRGAHALLEKLRSHAPPLSAGAR